MGKRYLYQLTAIVAAVLLVVLTGLMLSRAEGRRAPAVPQEDTTPGMMSYQGRLMLQGRPYSGTAYLKFAIVSHNGVVTETHWSNDGTSYAGSEPGDAIAVTAQDGYFNVNLGASPMVSLTASVFDLPGRELRIWAGQSSAGPFTRLTPDRPFGTVPYAFNADLLDGVDGEEYRRRYDNVIDVAPAYGDADTLAEAVALIYSSGPNNTWLIRVAPGLYAGNVTLPPYVHLRGSGVNVTFISATLNNTGGLLATLVLSDSDELSELTVSAGGPSASEIAAVESGGDDVWIHHVRIQAGEAYTSYGLLVDGGDTRLSNFEVSVGGDAPAGCGIAVSGGNLTGLDGHVEAHAGRWAAAVLGDGESLALLRDVWGTASSTTETFGLKSVGAYFTLEDVAFDANGSGSTYAFYLHGGDVDVSGSHFVASGGMAYGVYVPITATGRIADSDITASGWVEEVGGVYNGQGADLIYDDVRIRSYGNQWRAVGMAVYKAAPVLRTVSVEAGNEDGSEQTAIGLYLEEPTGGEWQDLFIVGRAVTDAYGIYVQGESVDLTFERATVRAEGYNARAFYLYGGGYPAFVGSDLLARNTGMGSYAGMAAVVEHDAPDTSHFSQFYVDSGQLRTLGDSLDKYVITGTVSSGITLTHLYAGGSLLEGIVVGVDATCAGAYDGGYRVLDVHCR